MIKLLFISLFFITQAHAFVRSFSLGVSSISSDSDFQDNEQNSLLHFKPNVAAGNAVSLETKWFVVGYVFAGSEANVKNEEKSKYQDIRLNFNLSHFDFRVGKQSYKGGLVDEGGKRFFYDDYSVESTNGRMHYYLNSKHLDHIRPGQALIRFSDSNKGFRASGSWLIGINVDDRHIQLPKTLQAEHQTILTNRGVGYSSEFKAFSWGPMAGYDALLELYSMFFRLKFAIGSAFQSTGETTTQSETAVLLGFTFAKNHMFSVGVDIFTMSFKDEKKYIYNNNTQANFLYTYSF